MHDMKSPRLNVSFCPSRPALRPRILQFGGGNFLRGFIDVMVDQVNERVNGDWGIVIVRAIADGKNGSLNEQDGLYTVIERGLDAEGNAVSRPRIVKSVLEEKFANTQWNDVLALARNPDIEIVTSNATDAGVIFDSNATYAGTPPGPYPANLTRLLHERWKALGDNPDSGWQILPCELIDHNGEELSRIVMQYADAWELEPDFKNWVKDANVFYNTLVDRIVPGFPRGEDEALRAELGYEDRYMTVAELFCFLAVEQKPDQPDFKLPLADHDTGTIITRDVTQYKARKVSILNGAHTALCPLALIGGVETVVEAMEHPAGRAFLQTLFDNEIIPFVSLPKDELESFAADTLRRFSNPFVRHRWHDISLNGLAKFRVRNLDNLLAYGDRSGVSAPLMSLSLAAWLAFYLGRFAGAAELSPRDDQKTLSMVNEYGKLDDGSVEGVRAMVSGFLSEAALWGRSIDTPLLREDVATWFETITAKPFSMDVLGELIQQV